MALSPNVSDYMFVVYESSIMGYETCVDEKGKEITAHSFQELINLKDNIDRALYRGKEIFIMKQYNKIIDSLSSIEGTMDSKYDSEFENVMKNFKTI